MVRVDVWGLCTVLLACGSALLSPGVGTGWAAEFNIVDFGAVSGDGQDDTLAVRRAFEACGAAGGGTVLVPRGTFIISRQASETPVLSIPSNTTVRGQGNESVLKFDPAVNDSNFWRMLGASQPARKIVIRDLRLDGSNRFERYEKGQTPEQNHGIFFYSKSGPITDVTIRDCLIENFSGDCVSFSRGCRNFTVRGVTVRNFIRQGIQMGGGPGDGGHLVTGCRDLEHSVQPGGSTIHVEHAEGARGFQIIENVCRNSLLAGGGARELVVRKNHITGRIEGNSIKDGLFEENHLEGSGTRGSLMQFGYADGLVIRGNSIHAPGSDGVGIYVWGTSRYNPEPSKRVTVEDNVLELKGQPIRFNGVRGGVIRRNVVRGSEASNAVQLQRSEKVEVASDR